MICESLASLPRSKAKLKQFVVSAPLDCVAIDLLGELPETENGNKYVLVITDYFTKWTQAFALVNMTAQTVADKIAAEFISLFGALRQLHSDQGRQFEAHLFQEVCKLLGIDKTRTTPYRPQSDGIVERFNRTIQQMLKHFVNENRNDWDDHLPYLTMAYRASMHESTGCTPNLLMLGRELPMPLDILIGQPQKQQYSCQIEYVEWLRYSMTTAYEYARRQLRKAATRQKRCYDLRSKETEFHHGNFVWRWYPPKANQKLGKGWTGPFRVMSCPTEVNVVIRYRPTDRDLRVHIDHLKPYFGDIPEVWKDFDDQMEEVCELDKQTSDPKDLTELVCDQDDSIERQDIPDNSDITDEDRRHDSFTLHTNQMPNPPEVLRRSVRQRKPPDKLNL